jgi:hypothetical protein
MEQAADEVAIEAARRWIVDLARGEAEVAARLATIAAAAGGSEAPVLAALAIEHAAAEAVLNAAAGMSGSALEDDEALAPLREEAVRRLVAGPEAALAWLLAAEHTLVGSYLALDRMPGLSEDHRRALRREWLPDAFDRFTRLDRLIAVTEDHDDLSH